MPSAVTTCVLPLWKAFHNGKTSIAAAIALELVRRGHSVHLTTTDPAAHLDLAVTGSIAGLRVSHIDPKAEVARYTRDLLDSIGRNLDAAGRDLLEEDLRSPCTEEVAVFRAFAERVAEGRDGFVVVDTAPTGHTLLLLDAAQSYHREVTRQTSEVPEAVRKLLPRLRDPDYSQVLIITLPQATPVHEAAALQADLRRAGIKPYAWVINQSFLGSGVEDPLLRAHAAQEAAFIRQVQQELAERCALVPWLPQTPADVAALHSMTLA